MRMAAIAVALATLALPSLATAAGLPAVTVVDNAEGGQTWTLSLQVLALMTALTFLPALVLGMSAFTRIIIVLSILRQALGTAQTPPNQVLIGISLFLTFFVMTPVVDQVNDVAVTPYLAGETDLPGALAAGVGPMREFMLKQTRETDLGVFTEIAGGGQYATPADVPLTILVPSFVVSELKTAFQIGFLVFIPFLIIDLVVSSVLMSMGMMMLSPMLISLPFKLMLFVLVDGWALIMGTLAASFFT